MLLLLPPSEGKAVAPAGRRATAPIDLDSLSFPALHATRAAVIDALVATSARPDARDVLGTPAGAAAAVEANTRLWHTPVLRVSDLYTGVLYDALAHDDLDTAGKRRATRRVVVVSALFGALRLNDRVPPYRLSMGVDLPGVGRLAAAWRGPLDSVLTDAAGRGVVVDLRSSTYVAAWRPAGAVAERTVMVHVVRPSDDGDGVTAVSHMAKHTRGLVAHHLLASGADPRTPEALAAVLGEAFDVALGHATPGRPRRLDVVEHG